MACRSFPGEPGTRFNQGPPVVKMVNPRQNSNQASSTSFSQSEPDKSGLWVDVGEMVNIEPLSVGLCYIRETIVIAWFEEAGRARCNIS